jgi:hypothetical protein
MLPAIAFCPVADVVDAVETLAEDIGDDYQGMLDYFEDTLIGRPGRRHRRDPRFSHDMWNVYHCTLQELPRTNNNIEGWHRGFLHHQCLPQGSQLHQLHLLLDKKQWQVAF